MHKIVKKGIFKRTSAIMVIIMLMTMLAPLLAFASKSFQITYDSGTGQITGHVESPVLPPNLNISWHGSEFGTTTDITNQLSIVATTTGATFTSNLAGSIPTGLNPAYFTVYDGEYGTSDSKSTVSTSVYSSTYSYSYINQNPKPNGLVNAGFETGDLTGWKLGTVTESVYVTGADGYATPKSGQYMARLGNAEPNSSQTPGPNEIYQEFIATEPTISFAYNMFTADYAPYDNFSYILEIVRIDTDEVVASYSQTAEGSGNGLVSTGWRVVTLDVSNHISKPLKLLFSGGGTMDSGSPTWVYIDSAQSEVGGVVTKTALTAAITAASAVHSAAVVGTLVGQYAQADKDALSAAIAAANEVEASHTVDQAQVDAAVTTLSAAVTSFHGKAVALGTKTALTAAITAASGVHSAAIVGTVVGQHAQADKDALSAVIAAAQIVKASATVNQAQVDAAVATLSAAVAWFKSKAVALGTKTALTAAITAASGVHSAAIVGTLVGQYAQADKDALSAAIAAAQVVKASATVNQAQVDAAVATLSAAVAWFKSKVIGTTLVLAESILAGSQNELVLTFKDIIHSVPNDSSSVGFTVTNTNVSITSAYLDSLDHHKVHLILSAAIKSSTEVKVLAQPDAIRIGNGVANSSPSEIHVILPNEVDQLRQDLLAEVASSDNKIGITNVVIFLQKKFATIDKHGISEADFLRFMLKQIDPIWVKEAK